MPNTNQMKSVNDNIQYVSIKKNTKYPINGRSHTYEDIYNMYKTASIGVNIPYHAINNVEDYNVTNNPNTLENTSTYTDIKALNTVKHKLAVNTSIYTHNDATNTDNVSSVIENIFHNNVDNTLPNNTYNSELYYDISTFIHIPVGLKDTINDISTIQGNITKNTSLSKNSTLTLTTTVPNDIYQKFINTPEGLKENDIFLISRSNIKYPEFKVDINELKFVTNNIDILPGMNPSTSGDIFYYKTFDNRGVENLTKNIEQRLDNLEVYNTIFNNQYYTIMRLNYSNAMLDRIRKYKINIHVPDNDYNIPLEFIKLSNIIFVKWKLSYTVFFNDNNKSIIKQSEHTRQLRDSNYNNGTSILPPITPISMGILPHSRANGDFPTNAYHYVYASTWDSRFPTTRTTGAKEETLLDLVNEAITHTTKYGFLESCCHYNDGYNMPWEIGPKNNNSQEVRFYFKSMLYEFPTKYCNTGTDNNMGWSRYKDGVNNIYNNNSAYNHDIMFFMSFARFIKDTTGVQIFYNHTVKDIPVTLELELSYSDNMLDEESLQNNNIETHRVVNRSIFNITGQSRQPIYQLKLDFPAENNQQEYSSKVKYSPAPPPAHINTPSGLPDPNDISAPTYTRQYSSINITGKYGAFKSGLQDDVSPSSYASNSKSLEEFKWEPNADAILSPRAQLGCANFNNYIYKLPPNTNDKGLMNWLRSTPIIVSQYYTGYNNTLWNLKQNYYTKYVNTLNTASKTSYYDPLQNHDYMPLFYMNGNDNNFKNDPRSNNEFNNMHRFTFNATLYELAEPDLSWLLTMFPVK